MFKLKIKEAKICVIGLGYIGLPLYTELSKNFDTFGYDINKKRISELKKCYDRNNQISKRQLNKIKKNIFFKKNELFKSVNTFIITVPTPIYKNKKPNLGMLIESSKFVGKILSKGSIIIFESTVYPGVVENICVPVLENFSQLKFNRDFFCGYSPERINPGDNLNTIKKVNKIISASDKSCLKYMKSLYGSFLESKIHIADSIKIAEASKVIENAQRDINIAFINEITIIFDKMKLDTNKILKAARTKWNFLDFKPGLVGGHCIGVDPYYLSYVSSKNGYIPKIINSGRQINDHMGKFICKKINRNINKKKINIKNSNILFLGLTFKENCPDIRNSKVFGMIDYYKTKVNKIHISDPLLNKKDLNSNYSKYFIKNPKKNFYDVVIVSVAHKFYKSLVLENFQTFCKKIYIIFDVKNILEDDINVLKL